MKSHLLLILALFTVIIHTSGQTIKEIDTDSATFYINTEVRTGEWGGHIFNGQGHAAIRTYAYSTYDGQDNTTKIVAALGAGTYAAAACDALVSADQSDWYLPSLAESQMIYKIYNNDAIFPTAWYWTSSDYENLTSDDFFNGDIYAWKKWFGGGEGDIAELQFKNFEWNNFFCIRKVTKHKFPAFELGTISALTNCAAPNGSAALTVSGDATGFTFQWYNGAVPSGEFFIEGVQATNLSAGTYSVVAVHTASQEKSAPVVFEIADARILPQVSIEAETNTLVATLIPNADYAWYFEAQPVGSNANTLIAEAPGQYTVKVTTGEDCISLASIALVITGSEAENQDRISIFPNPGNGYYYIQTKAVAAGTVVTVRNTMGQIVCQKSISNSVDTLDLTNLPSSVYFVSLQGMRKTHVTRIVKE